MWTAEGGELWSLDLRVVAQEVATDGSASAMHMLRVEGASKYASMMEAV